MQPSLYRLSKAMSVTMSVIVSISDLMLTPMATALQAGRGAVTRGAQSTTRPSEGLGVGVPMDPLGVLLLLLLDLVRCGCPVRKLRQGSKQVSASCVARMATTPSSARMRRVPYNTKPTYTLL